jgi:hypothetical protein
MKESLPEHMTKAYPCRICGKVTRNWITLSLSTNDCACSDTCLGKEMQRKKEALPRSFSQISLPGFYNSPNILF